MLIEKGLTKTELRLQTGISTNMLAKMGKDEAVSLDTLVRIMTQCELWTDNMMDM